MQPEVDRAGRLPVPVVVVVGGFRLLVAPVTGASCLLYPDKGGRIPCGLGWSSSSSSSPTQQPLQCEKELVAVARRRRRRRCRSRLLSSAVAPFVAHFLFWSFIACCVSRFCTQQGVCRLGIVESFRLWWWWWFFCLLAFFSSSSLLGEQTIQSFTSFLPLITVKLSVSVSLSKCKCILTTFLFCKSSTNEGEGS
jgi:hypothetical protein